MVVELGWTRKLTGDSDSDSEAQAELNMVLSLRSRPMTARYMASVMASRGVRAVREMGVVAGCGILGKS